MKSIVGKYLFEVVVIFIGITASFIFDEWRQNREKDAKANEMMKSLLIELERNDSYISYIDSNYYEIDSSIQQFLGKEFVSQDEVIHLSYMLLEQTSMSRLNGISSFILGFTSQDQLNIINKNPKVLSYLSYLENLLTEHAFITNELTKGAASQLWPLFNKYGLTNDIVNTLKEEADFETTPADQNGEEILTIRSDPKVKEQLKLYQLKILRLIQINEAIHFHIGNIKYELNRTIKGGE